MERHASVDDGAMPGSRFDRERSAHHFQALFHADEANARALVGRFAIEASAGVAHHEMNLLSRFPQLHFKVSHATVFSRIVQGFLQYSKQT